MVYRTETRVEEEFWMAFHKQVSIQINTQIFYEPAHSLTIHNSYGCMDDASVAECFK